MSYVVLKVAFASFLLLLIVLVGLMPMHAAASFTSYTDIYNFFFMTYDDFVEKILGANLFVAMHCVSAGR